MRSVSGVLNRTVLAGCGLLIAAASSWLLASGLGAGRSWPDAAPYLATAQDRVDGHKPPQAQSSPAWPCSPCWSPARRPPLP